MNGKGQEMPQIGKFCQKTLAEVPVRCIYYCQSVSSSLQTSLSFRFLSESFSYARDNLALVSVYIKQPVVTRIVRDERLPVIW